MIYYIYALIFIVLLFFALIYYCYRLVFAVTKKQTEKGFELPEFKGLGDYMNGLIEKAAKLSYEDVYTTSFDGLRLHARLYKGEENAPVQILFHGYKGSAMRDFCGGLQLSVKCGCTTILVDQRAHGESEGKALSFGILERRDCVSWANFAAEKFGTDVPIILTGISMGASTVMMASSLKFNANVVGIIADCGYTSPKDIICDVIKNMRLPVKTVYALIKLGARLFGGFNLEECDTQGALSQTDIPVLFIHGEADSFVPCDMTRASYAACTSDKQIMTVEGAGHGLSYMVAGTAYHDLVSNFIKDKTAKKEC